MITFDDIKIIEIGDRIVAAERRFRACAGDVWEGGKHHDGAGHKTIFYTGLARVTRTSDSARTTVSADPTSVIDVEPNVDHRIEAITDCSWGCWFFLANEQQLLPKGEIEELTLERFA